MPGQFINSGTNPFGNLVLTNNSNSGNLVFSKGEALVGPFAPYLIYQIYQPALVPGAITLPDHATNTGVLNPDLVGGSPAIALYINPEDGNNVDHTAELVGLVGNHTHLTLSWTGGNYVTYDCLSTAFHYDSTPGVSNFYYDVVFGGSPYGSINVIASSGTGASYTNQEVTISYIII
jgi:hypothetical protein